ncbi:hypothetical protein J2Z44_002927 [Clostridium punense]|uniref:YcxB-like protein domain-containing protein n=1 Tax=Clostridium punense TaxID=1054297 RepID=A0ABS4K5P2_9CLOT|nr:MULTISPECIES: hypothetical protein [Clostridium]EQB86406.1 hypothetical protein M918_14570 [Clostridium sp. BL8]MBP2023093.1 hypothetical protein [Clostridium punense]
MNENIKFQVTSKIDLSDIVQLFLVSRKKQYLTLKIATIIGMFIISISLIIDLQDCLLGDFSRLPFMIFCLICLIVFSVTAINFNKIQMKLFSKKFFGNNKEVLSINKLRFYDTYFTIENDENEMTMSAYITVSYTDVNYFVLHKNLIIFGDKTKAKSVTCIKQNTQFEIGTLEEFLHFFKNKINI